MNKFLSAVAVVALAAAVPAAAQTPTLAPGSGFPSGTFFSGFSASGDATTAAGRTFRFSGFDASQFDELYWSFKSVSSVYNPTAQAVSPPMAYGGYNAATGMAWWNPTAPTVVNTYSSPGVVFGNVFLVAQFQPYSAVGGPMASGWLTPTTAGAAGIPGFDPAQAFLDISSGTDFQVWFGYRMCGNPSCQSLDSWFDGIALKKEGQSYKTSASGAMYYTPEPTVDVAAAPEPATFVLLGSGLAGLAAVGRRRRRSA